MKTKSRKSIAAVTVAIMMAGVAVGTEEPQLKLRDKTITIYPILLRQLNPEGDTVRGSHDSMLSENLGLLLEQWGMLPRISAEEFPADRVRENLITSVKNSDAFLGKPINTDYALILLFEGKGKDAEEKLFVRAQAIMTDAQGNVVWSQPPGEFISAGNMWPISLYFQIGGQLLSASDLEKPDTRPEPGPLETRVQRKRKEAAAQKLQQRQSMKESEKEITIYKPDPHHIGKYADPNNPSNYIELKPDGSLHIHQDGHDLEGSFAVIKKGNLVIFNHPKHGSHPLGRIEGNKFITNDGDGYIKTKP